MVGSPADLILVMGLLSSLVLWALLGNGIASRLEPAPLLPPPVVGMKREGQISIKVNETF